MEHHYRIIQIARYLKIFGVLSTVFAWTAFSQAAGISVSHHIQIELAPAEMKLHGKDDISLKSNGVEVLEFRLSKRVSQAATYEIEISWIPVNFNFKLRYAFRKAKFQNFNPV